MGENVLHRWSTHRDLGGTLGVVGLVANFQDMVGSLDFEVLLVEMGVCLSGHRML
jgi:hypothetical protein